jgi:hypothetical protein
MCVDGGDAGLAQPMYILEGSAADLQADGPNRESLNRVLFCWLV